AAEEDHRLQEEPNRPPLRDPVVPGLLDAERDRLTKRDAGERDGVARGVATDVGRHLREEGVVRGGLEGPHVDRLHPDHGVATLPPWTGRVNGSIGKQSLLSARRRLFGDPAVGYAELMFRRERV